jgi:hypothetical protein
LNLEVLWNQRVKTLESKKIELEKRNSELELKLASTCPSDRGYARGKIPPIGRQTDMEKIWQKSMPKEPRHRSQAGLSTFTPHIPLAHRTVFQGPASLPTELIKDAQKEVRRLQELRRYIQEECDHLMLRKDRLKDKVGHKSVNIWQIERNSRSLDAYLYSGDNLASDGQATHSLCDVATRGAKVEDRIVHSGKPYKVVETHYYLKHSHC